MPGRTGIYAFIAVWALICLYSIVDCVGPICLSCQDVPNPQDCLTINRCGDHEVCSMEQYITQLGFVRHKMECKDKLYCGGSTLSSVNTEICSECCDKGDLCAVNLCGNKGYPATLGPVCYNCQYPVNHPGDCGTITACGRDEVCGVNQLPTGQYEVKCRTQESCNKTIQKGVCAKCCNTQLCNNDCATSNQVCSDSSSCSTLLLSFTSAGQDLCTQASMKYFCNATCGICPSTTVIPGATVVVTSPAKSAVTTAAMTSPLTTKNTQQSTTVSMMSTSPGSSCQPNPCLHGQCTDLGGVNYRCTCNPGYIGNTCDTVSICQPNPCLHGQCVDMGGTNYKCTCNNGYTGQNCDSVIVLQACQPNPCQHGQCTDLGGTSYNCKCNPGYTGHDCNIVDPCTNNPCRNGTCHSQSGSYQCTCVNGYTGLLCDTDINECQSSPCIHGTCFDKIGTYNCRCHTGYSGQNCDQDTNDCASSPCQHGTCTDKVGGYMCTCDTGYEGQNCDHDVDDCANTACIHGTCIDLLGGYQCNCYTGYTGQVCDQVLSACHTNPCQHGTCTDLGGSNYKCTCNSGYIGQNCDTQNPCKLTNPCRNGTCHVTTGGVYCICNNGYTGTLCDTDINECASSPCVHGQCLDRIAGYQCQCNPGYAGQNCDQLLVIRDCKDVKDQSLVSPSHDDIYLIDIGGSQVSIKCDLHTDNGGWTVIMNRNDGSLDFENKDSTDYAIGFGDVRHNFWKGLENMHTLTSDGRRYQLRVEMTDDNGRNYYETYDDFYIGASKKFDLHIGAASGTAGDSLRGHNGLGFTTTDVDQDTNPANCADYLGGGWWFHTCYDSCLTCPYATPGDDECRSMSWNTIKYCVALKTAKMMIRPM